MSRAWVVEGIEPDGTLAANARRILATRIGEYYAFAPAVPVESAVAPLHDLRIAAKRLRYSLELFRVVFGEAGERQIERIKGIQEELGAIHDHDVRIAMIETELRSLAAAEVACVSDALAATPTEQAAIVAGAMRPAPDDPRRGLIGLLGREHGRRAERYRAFVALWDRLAAEGMRAELVALSARQLPETSTSTEGSR